jgi:GAF domain-containing protein
MTANRDRQSGTTGLDARVHLAPANVHAGLPAAEAFALTGQPPRGPDNLGVQIRRGDAVLGNLYVAEHTDGAAFSPEDQQLAEALAVTAGGAIASGALFSESERRCRWLVASGELTNLLLGIDRQQPLSLVTQHAATGADADFVILELPHGDDHVQVAAVSGAVQAGIAGRTTSIEASVAGRTILTGKPALVDKPDLNGPFALDADSGPQIVVPLTAGEHTLGALTLGRTADRPPFTETDLDMAASFATQAAVALELADARDTQLRLNREEDHDRIAADLHDHVIQELFALGMGLQGLASITKQPAQLSRITSYVDMLDKVIGTIRRTIFQLQPTDPMPPV